MNERDFSAFDDPDFVQEVRETAYFLWEHAGKPNGQEQHYWFEALDRCLRTRQSDIALKSDPRD